MPRSLQEIEKDYEKHLSQQEDCKTPDQIQAWEEQRGALLREIDELEFYECEKLLQKRDALLTKELSAFDAAKVLKKLEDDRNLVLSHWQQLEEIIAACQDQIYALAQEGEEEFKMYLVALEFRARRLRGEEELGGN